MAGKDGDKEYTQEDMKHDMKEMAKMVKIMASNNRTVMERMETVENIVNNAVAVEEGDESFGSEDKRGAAQWLSRRVIDPDEKMLPQMTETPDRMIMALVVEHARNEFIREHAFNPDSEALFSDIFMKWFNIVMRSRNRALIGEAMGFSQIEVDKTMDEAARGLEAQEG